MFVLIEKADVGALLRSIPRQRLPSAEALLSVCLLEICRGLQTLNPK